MSDSSNRTIRGRRPRCGAIIVMVAVSLAILMTCVVFSIDVAYMQLTRMELRSAVDAATRAGAEALSREQDKGVTGRPQPNLGS